MRPVLCSEGFVVLSAALVMTVATAQTVPSGD
jgi:hypothetical protein